MRSINQKGQASIEYVLVLVIVIMIGLGIVWRFNSAFRNFASSYFGQYLDCLLANGELPSISSGRPGTCDAEFTPFDLATGRSPINPNSGGSNGGDGSSPSPSGQKGGSGSKSSDSKSSSDGRSGGGSTASSSPSRKSSGNDAPSGLGNDSSDSSRVPVGPNTRSASKFATKSAGGGPDRESEEDRDGDQKPTYESGAQDSGRYGNRDDTESGRLRYVPRGAQAERDGGEESLRPKRVPASEADSSSSTGRVALQDKARKAAASEDLDGAIGLPDFLRYLLIAAIIIALVLFLGGQAVQINKGQDGGAGTP